MIDYLELDDVLFVADRLGFEVGDYGLLESALARPRARVFGEDAYASIHEKAAALFHSLATNHALVDGNKRLSWVALRLFYELNGYRIAATEDERFDLVLSVATVELDTVAKIAHRLAAIASAG